jgi:transposase
MVDPDRIELESLYMGAQPLLDSFLERLRLAEILDQALDSHDRRVKLDSARVLLVLIRNVVLSRRPLYAVPQWAGRFVPECLGLVARELVLLNDDRIGRSLDQLYEADRATLQTRLVVQMTQAFQLDLAQFHHDSTTVTFSGEYAERPPRNRNKPPVRLTFGYNKDHRPDLKQLVWDLTVSEDGAVPVHCRVYDGNMTDDQTHRETWDVLRALSGRADFIYVADSKLCTKENMTYIAGNQGRFITVLPQTRAEDAWFKAWIQKHEVTWTELQRRPHRRRRNSPDEVYEGYESPRRSAEGYRILWIRSSQKWDLDRKKRQRKIDKALWEIGALPGRIGSRSLKTQMQIQAKVEAILTQTGAARWVTVEVIPREEHIHKQAGPGRPGKNTAYVRIPRTTYDLKWQTPEDTMRWDARIDGLFPLITNIEDLSIAEVLAKYKYQPHLEKRHEQLKTVLEVAPINLKTPERIEAFLFIYFVALLVHALVERQLRQAMKKQDIKTIPIYPEQRPCRRPTADKIIEFFESLRRHRLLQQGVPIKTFWDRLTNEQRQILRLLEIPSSRFGQ